MPNRRISNKLKLDTNTKINSVDNISINQSPKISSGKFRTFLDNKNSFSMLDVNEKDIMDKGPSLPVQYKRLSSKEIKEIFHMNKLENYRKAKKLKISSMKNILLDRMALLNIVKNQTDKKNNKTENQKENRVKTERKSMHKNNTFSGEEIKKLNKRGIFIQRPQTSKATRSRLNFQKLGLKTEEIKDSEKTYIKRDIWKPLNYEIYEEMVKNKKIFITKMQENPFFKRLPQCSIREIKEKTRNSDIFFLKQKIPEKFELERERREKRQEQYNSYFDSDIFNLKNNEININKIGEKYLFNNPKNIKYTSTRESKSEWKNVITKDALNNCSSKNYNILTPNRKNNNLTKDDIYKILNDKKVLHNPLRKQNVLSKYMDLANNSSSNSGQEYLKFYNANPDCFKKVPEHCGTFGDLYLQYKNLCDEPFYKKTTIKE
jgi:hypothetical protein